MPETVVSQEVQGTIKVDIESEMIISDDPARVLISVNDQLIVEIVAEVKPGPGADGKPYPRVVLTKK